MQIVLWLLLSVPFVSLKAQQSLWVGEEYQCFLTDYANTSLSILNVSWTVPSEMKEEFSGTYVRTVSFSQYQSGTYSVRASWKETDMSDSFSPFYSKSHTWSFTCRDNPLVLNNSSLTLTKGSTGTIGYSHTYSNEYTSLAKVTYSSSNSSVASVSSTGVVTAKGTGTATITVTSTIAKDPKTCTVKVTNSSTPDPDPTPGPVVPTGISLPASQSVQVGSTITLTPTITPSNASTTLTWDSSDKTVATVSSGKVSGKSVGTTTITVKTSNNKTASCTVTVTPVEPTGISLPESMTVAVGDFISVTPTITPSNAETTFTWSSNDESIAIAYANGMIEGVKVGTTRIKVVTANNLVAWSTVYVKPAPESIALSSESIDILEGDVITLTPTLMPSDAVSTLTWRSEDTSIATVTSEGVVEGIEAGTTRIWVETSNWLSASCIVNVSFNANKKIGFSDARVKALCVANWDTDGDGELNKAEAAAVTSLGEVFKEDKNIKSFDELKYFTGIDSIGNLAFKGCSGLTSVTIPGNVTSIGSSAFSSCTSLTTVNIPKSVTSIGSSAFYDCSGLTSVTIPNSVTSVGNSTFSWCTGLTSVTIPNSVTSIGDYAFSGCRRLTSVTIPNNVTSIGDYAFGRSGLTSVTIPNSVTSIGEEAFYDCSGLTSVTIPNSVTSIGDYAFRGCSGLISIVVEAGNKVFDSRDNSNAIIKTASNTLIAGCMNTIIPESVTSIGDDAFSGCSGLTSVIIPESVTSIGDDAFSGCSSLTSVTIPGSVTSIGRYAFFHCRGLTSVIIGNGVTSIGNSAFNGCSGLTSIKVESGNTVYDSRNNCNAIIETASNILIAGCMNTIIPESVTSIGDKAFYWCSGLTSITIPNSVTYIFELAFYECSGLTSVTIGSGVTSIFGNAFSRCSGLTSVTIGSGVTSIFGFAFYECSGLQSIICYAAETPKVNENTFYDVNVSNVTLLVPRESVQKYKDHPVWGKFKIEVIDGIEEIKNEELRSFSSTKSIKNDVYDLSGRKLPAEPQRGINIIRYSDGSTKKVLIK